MLKEVLSFVAGNVIQKFKSDSQKRQIEELKKTLQKKKEIQHDTLQENLEILRNNEAIDQGNTQAQMSQLAYGTVMSERVKQDVTQQIDIQRENQLLEHRLAGAQIESRLNELEAKKDQIDSESWATLFSSAVEFGLDARESQVSAERDKIRDQRIKDLEEKNKETRGRL